MSKGLRPPFVGYELISSSSPLIGAWHTIVCAASNLKKIDPICDRFV
jgi:hypothetical protein